MSGKSRHDRKKHAFRGKRKRNQRRSTNVITQQVDIENSEPIVSPVEIISPTEISPSRNVLNATHYPYLVAELQRIGILAGIILIILGVLASALT